MTIEESNIRENIQINPTNNVLTRTKLWFHKMLDNITSYFNDNNNTLQVISVISNPINYKRRYELMTQFIDNMMYNGGLNNLHPKRDTNIKLYIVELAYGNQEFVITESDNKNHLQLRCEYPLWHKEKNVFFTIPNDISYNNPYLIAFTENDIYYLIKK